MHDYFGLLVVSSVSPTTGSTVGGTTLLISGQYFSYSTQYPIVVYIGGEICTISNVTLTTIQCTTPSVPSSIRSQYQGQSMSYINNS